MPLPEVDPERHIDGVVQRVQAAFRGDVPPSVVEARVRETFAAWGEVPIRDFLPILVEREVVLGLRRERLGVGAGA